MSTKPYTSEQRAQLEREMAKIKGTTVGEVRNQSDAVSALVPVIDSFVSTQRGGQNVSAEAVKIETTNTEIPQVPHSLGITPPPAVPGGGAGGDGVLLQDVVFLVTTDNSLHVTNIYTDGRDDIV